MAVVAPPTMQLQLEVSDVTSRISLDSIGGTPDAPVLSLALGLKINLLDLVGLLGEFQQRHQGQGQAQPTNPHFVAAQRLDLSAPPPPPPPTTPSTSGAAAGPAKDLAGRTPPAQTRLNIGAAPAQQQAGPGSASEALSSSLSKEPKQPAAVCNWDVDISSLQPSQEEYTARAKWTAPKESAAGSEAVWKLSDEAGLRGFAPRQLGRRRPLEAPAAQGLWKGVRLEDDGSPASPSGGGSRSPSSPSSRPAVAPAVSAPDASSVLPPPGLSQQAVASTWGSKDGRELPEQTNRGIDDLRGIEGQGGKPDDAQCKQQ